MPRHWSPRSGYATSQGMLLSLEHIAAVAGVYFKCAWQCQCFSNAMSSFCQGVFRAAEKAMLSKGNVTKICDVVPNLDKQCRHRPLGSAPNQVRCMIVCDTMKQHTVLLEFGSKSVCIDNVAALHCRCHAKSSCATSSCFFNYLHICVHVN